MPDYDKYVKDAPDKWTFDRYRLDRLRGAYAIALANGEDEFIFDDRKLITNYAKYLIEYLSYKLDHPLF